MRRWTDETVIGCVMMFLLAVIGGLIYVAAVSPSCEDQGKRSVLVYFMPLVQMVGNIPVTNMLPIYECR